MDQLDKAVEIFCSDLYDSISQGMGSRFEDIAYSIIFLVKVIDVAVQDLDEKFDRHGSIHTCVSNPKRTLQAFEDSLAVSVELSQRQQVLECLSSSRLGSPLCPPFLPSALLVLSRSPTKDG